MSLSSTPRAASGAGGQFRVEQQGSPDHHALAAHEPRADVAEFAVLHHELDLSLVEHAGLALDEHERIQALGHQRRIGHAHGAAGFVGEHADARIHFRLQLGVEVLDRAAHLHAPGRRVDDRRDALDAPVEALFGPGIGLGGHRLADRDLAEMLLRQIHHQLQVRDVGDDEKRIGQVRTHFHAGIRLALGHYPAHGRREVQGLPDDLSAPRVVAERKANPGMEVRPDLPDALYIVTDVTHLQLVVDLPEQHLGKISVGQPVAAEADAWPEERFHGRIERIAPVVDPATRRVQVRCSVENLDAKLKPEMYARVSVLADETRSAVRVPNSALVTEGLYSFVFVEREPGVFDKRKIELMVQDREFSYVGAGLMSGERVVVRGALLLNSELASGT